MARKFKIVTDSSCDLPEEYYEKNDIEVVKLGFLMDSIIYFGEDGANIETHDFYEKVRAGAMPTTYQVNVESAKLHIEKYLKNGEDVLVVAFSGGLSGTANSFMIAAKELCEAYPDRKVMVTDSLCASAGEGLYLDYAIRYADTGASLEETHAYLEGIKLNMCHFFTVDNLFHLQRGGRVSKATAIVGTLLKIKPVLHVDDEGHLINIDKAMGRKKSIRALFDKMKETQCMEAGEPVFISHGDCEDEANYLADMIRAEYPNNPVSISYIGAVIGSHSGPGTIALFFRGNHR